jgi:hypothetical protein
MMVVTKLPQKENAMNRFVSQYTKMIHGTVSCFDRLLFKGYLPLQWGEAMERFLARRGKRITEFGRFVQKQSQRIARHAEQAARKSRRPFIYLSGNSRKEDLVRDILARDGVTEGLVCVLRTVEPCQSFKMVPGKGRPRLVSARRKCLFFYFYFLDRQWGLVHVRIQSWFPLVIQVCCNGHEILARKLDQHGIAYHKQDNAFTWIEDVARAQRLSDKIVRINWARKLSALARRVNPLLGDLLKGMHYYWVTDQAEYATDVMFESPASLKPLYEKLVKHATLCFSAEDVLTFLGRKLHGSFQGEVLTDMKKKRWPGARVKHRVKQNWIKMYDKHGCVLRIETVINQPREFKVRRRGNRRGRAVIDWFPLCKGVANLFRYAELSRAANARYLDALATVEPPRQAAQTMRQMARSVRQRGRSFRGFNPALAEDVELFAAVMRGEHAIHGFRNEHIRCQLFGTARSPHLRRRHARKVSRLLKRLHAHGLLAKVPRTRRWRPTEKGAALMITVLKCHYERYPDILAALAA